MQKNFFAMAMIACAILMSCSKTPTTRSSYENVSDQVIDEFMNVRDSVSQKASFKLLTEPEKATLWNRHIQSVAGRMNLSTQQSNIIKSVYAIIDNFYNGSPNVRSDQQLAMEKLQPAIFAAFDRGTAYRLFYSVYDPAYKFSNGTTTPESSLLASRVMPADGEGGGGGTCTCNVGSAFCVCCGTSPLGTTVCSGATGCTTTSSGCGLLFMYACNGSCIFV